jgi:hypothetical protein
MFGLEIEMQAHESRFALLIRTILKAHHGNILGKCIGLTRIVWVLGGGADSD